MVGVITHSTSHGYYIFYFNPLPNQGPFGGTAFLFAMMSHLLVLVFHVLYRLLLLGYAFTVLILFVIFIFVLVIP